MDESAILVFFQKFLTEFFYIPRSNLLNRCVLAERVTFIITVLQTAQFVQTHNTVSMQFCHAMAFAPVATQVFFAFTRSAVFPRSAVCSDCTSERSLFSHYRRATIVSNASGENVNPKKHIDSTSDGPRNSSDFSVDGNESRAKINDIAREGERMLENVADGARRDMDELPGSLEIFADKIIKEETEALLEKYENRQDELLEKVRQERRIIEEEMNRVKSVTSSTSLKPSDTALSEKILLGTTLLFGLAAMAYTWTAIAYSDGTALRSAIIDMAFAVCAAYVLSSRGGVSR